MELSQQQKQQSKSQAHKQLLNQQSKKDHLHNQQIVLENLQLNQQQNQYLQFSGGNMKQQNKQQFDGEMITVPKGYHGQKQGKNHGHNKDEAMNLSSGNQLDDIITSAQDVQLSKGNLNQEYNQLHLNKRVSSIERSDRESNLLFSRDKVGDNINGQNSEDPNSLKHQQHQNEFSQQNVQRMNDELQPVLSLQTTSTRGMIKSQSQNKLLFAPKFLKDQQLQQPLNNQDTDNRSNQSQPNDQLLFKHHQYSSANNNGLHNNKNGSSSSGTYQIKANQNQHLLSQCSTKECTFCNKTLAMNSHSLGVLNPCLLSGIFCKYNQLGMIIQNGLSKRYSTNRDYYNVKTVNDLIYNENTHIVSIFKDYLILDDINEFLKRSYNQQETKARLPKLCTFYDKYSQVFPNYVVLPESKYMFKNIQKKQKLIDEQYQLQEELAKKEHQSLIDDDRLFSSRFYNSVYKLESNIEDMSMSRQQYEEQAKQIQTNGNHKTKAKRFEEMKIDELMEKFLLKNSADSNMQHMINTTNALDFSGFTQNTFSMDKTSPSKTNNIQQQQQQQLQQQKSIQTQNKVQNTQSQGKQQQAKINQKGIQQYQQSKPTTYSTSQIQQVQQKKIQDNVHQQKKIQPQTVTNQQSNTQLANAVKKQKGSFNTQKITVLASQTSNYQIQVNGQQQKQLAETSKVQSSLGGAAGSSLGGSINSVSSQKTTPIIKKTIAYTQNNQQEPIQMILNTVTGQQEIQSSPATKEAIQNYLQHCQIDLTSSNVISPTEQQKQQQILESGCTDSSQKKIQILDNGLNKDQQSKLENSPCIKSPHGSSQKFLMTTASQTALHTKQLNTKTLINSQSQMSLNNPQTTQNPRYNVKSQQQQYSYQPSSTQLVSQTTGNNISNLKKQSVVSNLAQRLSQTGTINLNQVPSALSSLNTNKQINKKAISPTLSNQQMQYNIKSQNQGQQYQSVTASRNMVINGNSTQKSARSNAHQHNTNNQQNSHSKYLSGNSNVNIQVQQQFMTQDSNRIISNTVLSQRETILSQQSSNKKSGIQDSNHKVNISNRGSESNNGRLMKVGSVGSILKQSQSQNLLLSQKKNEDQHNQHQDNNGMNNVFGDNEIMTGEDCDEGGIADERIGSPTEGFGIITNITVDGFTKSNKVGNIIGRKSIESCSSNVNKKGNQKIISNIDDGQCNKMLSQYTNYDQIKKHLEKYIQQNNNQDQKDLKDQKGQIFQSNDTFSNINIIATQQSAQKQQIHQNSQVKQENYQQTLGYNKSSMVQSAGSSNQLSQNIPNNIITDSSLSTSRNGTAQKNFESLKQKVMGVFDQNSNNNKRSLANSTQQNSAQNQSKTPIKSQAKDNKVDQSNKSGKSHQQSTQQNNKRMSLESKDIDYSKGVHNLQNQFQNSQGNVNTIQGCLSSTSNAGKTLSFTQQNTNYQSISNQQIKNSKITGSVISPTQNNYLNLASSYNYEQPQNTNVGNMIILNQEQSIDKLSPNQSQKQYLQAQSILQQNNHYQNNPVSTPPQQQYTEGNIMKNDLNNLSQKSTFLQQTSQMPINNSMKRCATAGKTLTIVNEIQQNQTFGQQNNNNFTYQQSQGSILKQSMSQTNLGNPTFIHNKQQIQQQTQQIIQNSQSVQQSQQQAANTVRVMTPSYSLASLSKLITPTQQHQFQQQNQQYIQSQTLSPNAITNSISNSTTNNQYYQSTNSNNSRKQQQIVSINTKKIQPSSYNQQFQPMQQNKILSSKQQQKGNNQRVNIQERSQDQPSTLQKQSQILLPSQSTGNLAQLTPRSNNLLTQQQINQYNELHNHHIIPSKQITIQSQQCYPTQQQQQFVQLNQLENSQQSFSCTISTENNNSAAKTIETTKHPKFMKTIDEDNEGSTSHIGINTKSGNIMMGNQYQLLQQTDNNQQIGYNSMIGQTLTKQKSGNLLIAGNNFIQQTSQLDNSNKFLGNKQQQSSMTKGYKTSGVSQLTSHNMYHFPTSQVSTSLTGTNIIQSKKQGGMTLSSSQSVSHLKAQSQQINSKKNVGNYNGQQQQQHYVTTKNNNQQY